MPVVKGKHFPYTAAGMKAAAKARMSKNEKSYRINAEDDVPKGTADIRRVGKQLYAFPKRPMSQEGKERMTPEYPRNIKKYNKNAPKFKMSSY